MKAEIFLMIPLLVYVGGMAFIFFFSLTQLEMLVQFLFRSKSANVHSDLSETELPTVTVQLPVYNEKYVIRRLLDSVATLDYPREKLEIQILDDSTDETRSLIDEWMSTKVRDLDVKVIRRSTRVGFKAGALHEGLLSCKGDLHAIFDADFIPPTDFLKKTITHFKDSRVGVVQTRWGHLNECENLLTRLQAFGLDAHFTIEQPARYFSGALLNFNGTAGIWRRECIHDSGGWSSDTLTEDLDLSFRAQLIGWKIVYDQRMVCPAELPSNIYGVIGQQTRWNKGGAETARKLLISLWKSSVDFRSKIHGTFQLVASSVFPALFFSAISSLILFWNQKLSGGSDFIFPAVFSSLEDYGSYAFIGFFSLALVYGVSAYINKQSFLVFFPSFILLNMGLSFRHSMAVLSGWMGKRSPFIRTPKLGGAGDDYLKFKNRPTGLSELLLGIIFIGSGSFAFLSDQIIFSVLHIMMGIGLLVVTGFLLRSR